MALAGTRPGTHYMWHRARDLRARCPLAPGGSAVMSRNGFTLLELLIVVVIIGLLPTIAIPKFSNTKATAYVASMKSDLRNLATAEETFFYDSANYTTNVAFMNNLVASVAVALAIKQATSSVVNWPFSRSGSNTSRSKTQGRASGCRRGTGTSGGRGSSGSASHCSLFPTLGLLRPATNSIARRCA